MIKEEDRLTSVIAEIDEDVSIVPRAAYQKWPTGEVVANRSFEGLTVSGIWAVSDIPLRLITFIMLCFIIYWLLKLTRVKSESQKWIGYLFCFI